MGGRGPAAPPDEAARSPAGFPAAEDEERRQKFCQSARLAVERAIQRTQEARQAWETAQQLQTRHGLEQAKEANGNDPGINRAHDWIPDYPSQGDPEDSADFAPRHYDDYPDDDEPDPEAEAWSDLHNR